MKEETKKDLIYLGALLALILIYKLLIARQWNLFYYFQFSDPRTFFYPIEQFIKISILQYHQFPHWMPTTLGGAPFFANAQHPVFSLHALFAILFPNIFFALNLHTIVASFIAGTFIYLICRQLKLSQEAAFTGAIIFAFSGYMLKMYTLVISERWSLWVWIPAIFYFMIKTTTEEDWLSNSILFGVALAIGFHAGALDFYAWLSFFIVLYYTFMIFSSSKGKIKQIKKTATIALVSGIVLFGLVAIKLIPLMEYKQFSNKSESGFGLEEARGEPTKLKDIPALTLFAKFHDYPPNIGFAAGILAAIGLSRYKNKFVIYNALFIIAIILFATGTFAFTLMWKYWPAIKYGHFVARTIAFLAFPLSILAAFGCEETITRTKKHIQDSKKRAIAFCLLLISILATIGFFTTGDYLYDPKSNIPLSLNLYPRLADIASQEESHPLFQFLKKQEGISRYHDFGQTAIGSEGYEYAVPLELQSVFGFNNVWIPEYFNIYLGISNQRPMVFWGMLNNKYIYSISELNTSKNKELEYLTTLKGCDIPSKEALDKIKAKTSYYSVCPEFADEYTAYPKFQGYYYVYENKLNLPRGYVVKNAALVLGEKNNELIDQPKQAMYQLMLTEQFSPSTNVIIFGEKGKVQNYDKEFIERFRAIIITPKGIDQQSINTLKQYSEHGGMLLPNIFENGQAITLEELNQTFFPADYKNVKGAQIKKYTPNKVIFNLEGQKGFFVLSEKFFMFDGWKATINGHEKEILRANGINSAVMLNGEKGDLVFEYKPESFLIGAIISTLTLLGITTHFMIKLIKKQTLKTKQASEHNTDHTKKND